MRSLRLGLLVLLTAARPSFAALARVSLPALGFRAAPIAVPVAAPALTASLAPSLPAVPPLAAPAPAAAAPAAAAPVRLAGSHNALIPASDVTAALSELRRASYEVHPQVVEIVARINAAHPELPITADNLFLVQDRALLQRLGIPENAAGAARIVTDGRREVPVVILVAARPIALDDFIEYAVHEAVHLMDDGILRVRHDEQLKHYFAEGWTQKRALGMANEILAGLGRPESAGKAYKREISLIDAFIARHGSAALDELVRTGSDAGLRAALGPRWDLASTLANADASRDRRVEALAALVSATSFGPAEESALLDYIDFRP